MSLHYVISLRYGIHSSIIASILVSAVGLYEPIFFSGGSVYSIEVILFIILLFVPLGVAAIGFVRNEEFHFSVDSTPTHIKRMSERERMATELEIARNV